MKQKFSDRIFNSLIQNGIEYDTAWELVYYQPRRALDLLNMILREKKKMLNT